MSATNEILEFLKRREEETRIERLLEIKGYANPQSDDFGLNQWTRRLSQPHSHLDGEDQPNNTEGPDRFVSFLAIPLPFIEEISQIDLPEIRIWLREYNWQSIYDTIGFFHIQGCSEGLLMPNWSHNSANTLLKNFLLVRREGVLEFCMGEEAYFSAENGINFRLIHIVDRLWQFMIFIGDLYEELSIEGINESLVVVNIRGTIYSYMGNVAKGWSEPHMMFDLQPTNKCIDKSIQISRRIKSPITIDEIEINVHWFATRIDNAWGYLEPRCYVRQDLDENQSFGIR